MDDDFDESDIEERKEKIREEEKGKKKDKEVMVKQYNKPEMLEKIRGNPWIISTIVMGILALFLIFANFSGGFTGNVSKDVAAANLMKFLVGNVQGDITLLDVTKDNGFYRVDVEYQENTIPLYVTMDGKYMASLQSLVFEDSSPVEIPKSEKPKVELFVMSFCPYGNVAEDTMLPVYNLLKDKVDWKIHYIVSVSGDVVDSLHGQPEVDQDVREVCVLNNYGMPAFWNFMTYVNENCGSDGSCWEAAALANGIDANVIETCANDDGLDLMKAEATASNEAGVSGSPTLIINGVESSNVYQYGDSELYKQTICSAFENTPAECSTQLESSSTTSSGGSC
jgi:hypothetical protein